MASEIGTRVGVTPEHGTAPSHLALKAQMDEWYGISLRADGLQECVSELVSYCTSNDRQLIIRDWTYQDFMPNKWNRWRPANRFTMLESLRKVSRVRVVALVRDAIDIYLSSMENIEDFARGHLRFVETLNATSVPVFKYEDLVKEPDAFIRRLCDTTGLEYSTDWSAFPRNPHATGDTRFGSLSRGGRARSVKALPRKRINKGARRRINQCKTLQQANRLLDYPVSYEQGESFETLAHMAVRRLRHKMAELSHGS
jgi:hypothetical protein